MFSDESMSAEELYYDSPRWKGDTFNHWQYRRHAATSRTRAAVKSSLLRRYGTTDPLDILTMATEL